MLLISVDTISLCLPDAIFAFQIPQEKYMLELMVTDVGKGTFEC